MSTTTEATRRQSAHRSRFTTCHGYQTPIRFAYDSPTSRDAHWDPSDSEKYELRVSYDNGETWGVYAQNIEGTEADVNGIYYGNSYLFRVYGVQEDGTLTRFYRETLFAPATITVAPVVYGLGDTITVNVVGSADAAVRRAGMR